ncbi:MAG TPA: winged helix-turn-helix domain-containing protein [Candidatus Acidoferrales bacterium]|nr:winged helix-turn-helix domain-containing protein [Candidatus Acidoferrales bacterium]
MLQEPATKVQDPVRFGDDFELDGGMSQLRRSGRVLKLERIPMEVLLLLVQQRGELVTREQIVEKIWGKDVYLDTDNGINGAIRKIRQALRDDPEQPRFIQTITRKGYRFIAPVIDPDPNPNPDPEPDPEPELVLLAAPQLSVHEDSPVGFGGWRWPALVGTMILVAVIVLIAILAYRRSGSPAEALRSERAMLAVLPFENLTGDASQEYFSDGMTEEMITQLGSRDPDHMGVIARTSVMHYKHSQEPLLQIARELGVQYVLEGSVRRDADKVRVTAQLILMRDQTHLWARQYDREVKDLLVIQSEIAREISGEIQTALGDRKPLAPIVQPTLSPEAYEAYNLYLKGEYFLNKRTVEGFREAISDFQQATAKDPTDARAYAGLADAYALIAGYSGAPAIEFASQARAAAMRAVQLDDGLPEAHAALGLIIQNHDYDWQGAEKEFKRAIELNPNYATAHQWYAEHLTWRGRFDEALRESARARQLDPLSLIIAADNGAILYYARQYDRAIAQFMAVRQMDPEFSRAKLISYVYVQKGMFAEALSDTQKHSHGANPWQWSVLAYIQGRAGQKREAAGALRKLLDLNRRQPIDPMAIAAAHIGMGHNDAAVAWLETARAQHSNGLTALKVDPAYDPLRGDPRFQDLLRRVGLDQ